MVLGLELGARVKIRIRIGEIVVIASIRVTG